MLRPYEVRHRSVTVGDVLEAFQAVIGTRHAVPLRCSSGDMGVNRRLATGSLRTQLAAAGGAPFNFVCMERRNAVRYRRRTRWASSA